MSGEKLMSTATDVTHSLKKNTHKKSLISIFTAKTFHLGNSNVYFRHENSNIFFRILQNDIF